MSFGGFPKGLKMDSENIPKVEESLKWFNKGWILAARYSEGSILTIGVLSKYPF